MTYLNPISIGPPRICEKCQYDTGYHAMWCEKADFTVGGIPVKVDPQFRLDVFPGGYYFQPKR